MKKILAVTIILATLVISTLAFMPSASAVGVGGISPCKCGWDAEFQCPPITRYGPQSDCSWYGMPVLGLW